MVSLTPTDDWIIHGISPKIDADAGIDRSGNKVTCNFITRLKDFPDDIKTEVNQIMEISSRDITNVSNLTGGTTLTVGIDGIPVAVSDGVESWWAGVHTPKVKIDKWTKHTLYWSVELDLLIINNKWNINNSLKAISHISLYDSNDPTDPNNPNGLKCITTLKSNTYANTLKCISTIYDPLHPPAPPYVPPVPFNPIHITNGFARAVSVRGELVNLGTFSFNWAGNGRVFISGLPVYDPPNDIISVDDSLVIINGYGNQIILPYMTATSIAPAEGPDITNLLRVGNNKITVKILDVYGARIGCGYLWITHRVW